MIQHRHRRTQLLRRQVGPAIVELPEVPSGRGHHGYSPDFSYTLGLQISNALNAFVIHTTDKALPSQTTNRLTRVLLPR